MKLGPWAAPTAICRRRSRGEEFGCWRHADGVHPLAGQTCPDRFDVRTKFTSLRTSSQLDGSPEQAECAGPLTSPPGARPQSGPAGSSGRIPTIAATRSPLPPPLANGTGDVAGARPTPPDRCCDRCTTRSSKPPAADAPCPPRKSRHQWGEGAEWDRLPTFLIHTPRPPCRWPRL